METVISTPKFTTEDLQNLYQEFADSNGLDLGTVAKNFYVIKIILEAVSPHNFEEKPFMKVFFQPFSDEKLSINNFVSMINDTIIKTTEEFKLQNPDDVILDIITDLDSLRYYWLYDTNIMNDLSFSLFNLHFLHDDYKNRYLMEH